jgi:hypothetical protein
MFGSHDALVVEEGNPFPTMHYMLVNTDIIVSLALHNFGLIHTIFFLGVNLEFWVLSQSTIWFL